MTLQGVDYAWGYTSSLPATLVKDGKAFVVRYVGTSSKCITKAELDALQAKGIGVALVYETTGQTFKGGESAGVTDGHEAALAMTALGAPKGMICYFAIDTDTADYASTNAYLAGCETAMSEAGYVAKLYAGYGPINATAGSDHWQTYAWSSGKKSLHASLYQYNNGVTIDGVSTDLCETLNGNLSVVHGWLVLASATVPTPTNPVPPVNPTPAPKPTPGSADKLRLLGNANPLGKKSVAWMASVNSKGTSFGPGKCKMVCRESYGITVSKTTSAIACWNYEGNSNQHSWYTPPAGVPVFWKGGSKGYGHIAIADGNGNVWSTDFGPNGYVGDGRVRLCPISSITKHDSLLHYLGWTATLDGVVVYTMPSTTPAPVAPTVTPATDTATQLAAMNAQIAALQAQIAGIQAQEAKL